MTVEEIFSNMSSHMFTGIKIHSSLSNAFSFLNLFGYQKCHEYHFLEESLNYRKLNDFYMDQYHKLIQQSKIEDVSIIPSSWFKYSREDVDTKTKRQETYNLFKKWVEWEKETRDLFQTYYIELTKLGEICAAREVAQFLDDVNKELEGASRCYIDLKSVDYDIVYIVEIQKDILEKYEKKICDLYKGEREQ